MALNIMNEGIYIKTYAVQGGWGCGRLVKPAHLTLESCPIA